MARNKEEYLRQKGLLPKEDLGTMFCFKSTRNSVSEIKEILIWNKYESKGWKGGNEKEFKIIVYRFKEAPYECSIWEDMIVSVDRGIGSGFGDLWEWSWFTSLNKDELKKARQIEIQRIAETYGHNSNQIEIPLYE